MPEPPEAGRLTVTPGLLAAIAGRHTARDRWLLAMLHEHRVLTTTTHITQLAFGTTRAATAARMLTLHRHQLADRFRPLAAAGTACTQTAARSLPPGTPGGWRSRPSLSP